jgi:branched-chain amino acid transport system permease protein
MTGATFLQLVVGGLTMGAIYALVAMGLYITHLTAHQVNFGQGDFVMFAGFLMLGSRANESGLLLAVVATVIGLAVLGYLLERGAIRPLDRYGGGAIGAYGWILTTAGVALILQNVVELVWGKSAQYSPPLFSQRRDDVVEFLGARFFIEELLVIFCAMVVVTLFLWFMRKSRWGKAIEVVAFNPDAAQLLGINTRAVKVSVFVIASVLAAIAGVLIGPIITLQPHMGLIFTIKALIVATVGGFSSPLGILLGGFLFGVAESFSNYVDSQFGDVYPLLVALTIVAIRPSGLFGERSQDVR